MVLQDLRQLPVDWNNADQLQMNATWTSSLLEIAVQPPFGTQPTVQSWREHLWLVVWTPLKNISQLGLLLPIYGKIKNVPNHQPDLLLRFQASVFCPRGGPTRIRIEKGQHWKFIAMAQFTNSFRLALKIGYPPQKKNTISDLSWGGLWVPPYPVVLDDHDLGLKTYGDNWGSPWNSRSPNGATRDRW